MQPHAAGDGRGDRDRGTFSGVASETLPLPPFWPVLGVAIVIAVVLAIGPPLPFCLRLPFLSSLADAAARLWPQLLMRSFLAIMVFRFGR